MKAFALTFFILCSGCIFAESVNLKCVFENYNWWVLGDVYNCEAHNQGDLIIDNSNRHVTTINGNTNSNPSVEVVHIQDSNCFYFPHGLQKLFPNMQGILIYSSKLREVRRDDLKEYTNLRLLHLGYNEIKFLEPNLFEFNPELEGIFLYNNKIVYIDANIFNNFVGKLNYLWLSSNICLFENAHDDTSKANQIIAKVQSGSCQDKSKLPTTTTTTTTPASTTTTTTIPTTTTTLAPTTTTPAPLPSVTSAQFDALMKLFEDLNKKLAAEKKESTELQVSLMQEVRALRSEVNGEMAALKDKLEATKTEIKAELKKDIKEVKDQNLDIKAGLVNITTQFEKRIKLIQNIVGVDPEHYNQP